MKPQITIFKYPIDIYTTLFLPKNAKVLTVQMQDGNPYIWVELDTSAKAEMRNFFIIGTGQAVTGGIYVGTYQDPPHVWHLYEEVLG